MVNGMVVFVKMFVMAEDGYENGVQMVNRWMVVVV